MTLTFTCIIIRMRKRKHLSMESRPCLLHLHGNEIPKTRAMFVGRLVRPFPLSVLLLGPGKGRSNCPKALSSRIQAVFQPHFLRVSSSGSLVTKSCVLGACRKPSFESTWLRYKYLLILSNKKTRWKCLKLQEGTNYRFSIPTDWFC